MELAKSECRAGRLRLRPQRINHFQKWEAMKISITRADSQDPMLTHENGGVGVVEDGSGKMRQLLEHLAGDVSMTLGRDKNVEAG